jgi:hypothetical protein
MNKYEIIFKLGQMNKCLDYEESPHFGGPGSGLWDEQIKRLLWLRDGLLEDLKAYRS